MANHSVTTDPSAEVSNTDNGDGTWTLKIQPGPRNGKDAAVFLGDDHGDSATSYPYRDLSFRNVNWTTGFRHHSLLHMTIPSGVSISSVSSARLYLNFADVGGPLTVNAHPITSAWTEFVTGNTIPTYDASLGSTAVSVSGWASWNVTSAVGNWVSSPSSNLGLALITAPTAQFWGFSRAYSAQTAVSTNRPYLEIVYTP